MTKMVQNQKGDTMRSMQAVKEIANKRQLNLLKISKLLGKKRGYVNAIITRGSEPRIDTYIKILDVCNYGLYAIPIEDAPLDAIQITID